MPLFAKGTIEITVPNADEKFEKLLNEAPEGFEFEGSIEEGAFKHTGHGVEGIFRSTSVGGGSRELRVTITKKPVYATTKKIEKELKKFLSED